MNKITTLTAREQAIVQMVKRGIAIEDATKYIDLLVERGYTFQWVSDERVMPLSEEKP